MILGFDVFCEIAYLGTKRSFLSRPLVKKRMGKEVQPMDLFKDLLLVAHRSLTSTECHPGYQVLNT